LLQEDILILHKRKIGSHASSHFIPYSTNRSRDPMYTFVFVIFDRLHYQDLRDVAKEREFTGKMIEMKR
jgi:hypothetical protein